MEENNQSVFPDHDESVEDSRVVHEVRIKDLELTKLDIQPGQILAITVKSNDLDEVLIESLRKNFKSIFPNNRVLIMGLGESDAVHYSVIQEVKADKEISSCATGSFCVDCNCGKKEQYEK